MDRSVASRTGFPCGFFVSQRLTLARPPWAYPPNVACSWQLGTLCARKTSLIVRLNAIPVSTRSEVMVRVAVRAFGCLVADAERPVMAPNTFVMARIGSLRLAPFAFRVEKRREIGSLRVAVTKN
jgi:hypothetical protein